MVLIGTLSSIQPLRAANTNTPKILCRIEVDDAHISAHIQRNIGLKFVKVDARSVCNTRQEQVRLTVEIFKIGKFADYFVVRYFTNPLDAKSNGLLVTNYGTFKICKDSTPTKYYGVAYSKAFIEGKWKSTVRTRSLHSFPLKCGT